MLQAPTILVDPGLSPFSGNCLRKYFLRFIPKDEDEDFQRLFHGVLTLSGACNFFLVKVLPQL